MADDVAWLTLVYKVPVEPARVRATVWRRLRGLGAVYLQDGVAAIPSSPAAERALRALQNEIGTFGGVGYLMGCQMIAGQSEITATYNRARDEEYEEIIDRCNDFEAEIAREIGASHFTYAELEENDEDLTKLKSWFAKVQARDVLGAELAQRTIEALSRCEAELERFAALVYEAEGSR